MATLREIRRRIKSVKNTAQITKAMELVAASRMRRAQERVIASRPYSEKMRSVLADLSAYTAATGGALHPLLDRHTTGKVCLVLLTSDRGLCGSFNTNLIRLALQFFDQHRSAGDDTALVTAGKRGRDFFVRYGAPVIAEFTGLSDRPTILDVAPIVRLVINEYEANAYKSVFLAYSQFVSTAVQRPQIVPLLPIDEEQFGAGKGGNHAHPVDYIFEPDAGAILNALLPRYIEGQVYQALLDSIASEQSARMIAMRNASDNALDIIDGLTLTYNKARQAAITKELIDITTSAAAIQ